MKSKIYEVEVYDDGFITWSFNGKLHREDGPAIKWADGTEFYYLNGNFHREDGPAIKWANGKEEYWLNNIEYSKEEFNKEIAKRQQKSLACENKEVMIDGIKYKLIKV